MPIEAIGDINLYHQVHGEGEPLVLIQGLIMDCKGFMFQTPVFSQKYKVILFDNRGTGRSDSPRSAWTTETMADDVAHLLDFLEIDSAHIVSLSLGSLTAQEFALKYPQRTRSLFLTATAACPGKQSPRNRFICETLLELVAKDYGMDVLIRLLMTFAFSNSFFDDVGKTQMVIDLMLANPTPQPKHGLIGQLAAGLNHDTRGRLSAITAPTKVLVGTEDLLVPIELAREVSEAIPDAEFEILQGAAHLICFEHPEPFNQSVLDFLVKVTASG